MAYEKKTGFTMSARNRVMELEEFRPFPSLNRKYNKFDTEVYIEHLEPFPDHPFRLYPEDKIEELTDSIRQNGILNRLIVRKNEDTGLYVILSGHNRAEAAKRAGLQDIPVCVVEVDDDTAKIIVTESNLKQREKLYPSEKARAYKMQLDALKRQGKRTDLTVLDEDETLSPLETKLNAGIDVAYQNNESRPQIYRYIRLLELSPELLSLVDEETIPFRAGVEISYLDPQHQAALYHFLFCRNAKLSLETAKTFKELSKNGELDAEKIEGLLFPQGVQGNPPDGAGAPGDGNRPSGNGEGERQTKKSQNPYAGVLKNLNAFIRKLPQETVAIDPAELETVIITAIETFVRSKNA